MSSFRTVRIWDYTQDACINVLSGHTAPVRGLLWNTEVPYLLISGGTSEHLFGLDFSSWVHSWFVLQDPGTTPSECGTPETGRVWTPSTTTEPMFTVRHSETRRIRFEMRTGWRPVLCCVCEGLTCHQNRPFTMASCSRDSTVRLWSLTPLVSPLLLNVLTEQPWEKITGSTGEA